MKFFLITFLLLYLNDLFLLINLETLENIMINYVCKLDTCFKCWKITQALKD
jgi:hypothetical protein